MSLNSASEYIVVYVCSCGNYYGSSSMGSLENAPNIAPVGTPDAGKIRSFRSTCPSCGGQRVKRYAHLVPEEEVAEAKRTAGIH